MNGFRDLPELVKDSRLEAIVRGPETIHPHLLGRAVTRWTHQGFIGRGGDGRVSLQRRVEGPGTFELRAVKQMPLDADIASEHHNSRRYVRELEALAKFAQDKFTEFFVRSYGWYNDQDWLYIAMEYCEHLDLGIYLKENIRFSEEHTQIIAAQVLGGLSLMHESDIAHQDLKPSNILVVSKPPNGWRVKLGDLGLSRRSGDAPGSTTVRGTPEFMAPETVGSPFDGNPKSCNPFSADMWCLGETLSRMLTGRTTFRDVGHLLRYQKGTEEFPDQNLRTVSLSNEGVLFIISLMASKPDQRLSASEALQHP